MTTTSYTPPFCDVIELNLSCSVLKPSLGDRGLRR